MIPTTSPFLSVAEVRAIDEYAASILKIPTLLLMENAGRNAAESIHATFTGPRRVLTLCGPGNNGGDGLVIARHLLRLGWEPEVWMIGTPQRLSHDCAIQREIVEACQIPLRWIENLSEDNQELQQSLRRSPVIVDAMLGTGSKGPLRHPMDLLVRWANASAAYRVAIDQPSGMDADTGAVGPVCFQASQTITFVAPKRGFQATEAKAYLGYLVTADIGIPLTLCKPSL